MNLQEAPRINLGKTTNISSVRRKLWAKLHRDRGFNGLLADAAAHEGNQAGSAINWPSRAMDSDNAPFDVVNARSDAKRNITNRLRRRGVRVNESLREVLSYIRRRKVLESIRSFAADRRNLMEAPRINLLKTHKIETPGHLRRGYQTEVRLADGDPIAIRHARRRKRLGNFAVDSEAMDEMYQQPEKSAINWPSRGQDSLRGKGYVDNIKRRLRQRGVKVFPKESAANEGGFVSRAMKNQLEG